MMHFFLLVFINVDKIKKLFITKCFYEYVFLIDHWGLLSNAVAGRKWCKHKEALADRYCYQAVILFVITL